MAIKAFSVFTHENDSDHIGLLNCSPSFLNYDKDEVVLVNQSHELYDQLISAGASATFIVVRNCGHAFTPVDGDIIPTRKEISNIIADFLDQYLKDSA